MPGAILRKYGVQTTFNFRLFEVDGVDFRVDAVHGTNDTKIMKDEGTEANTTNAFTDEGQGYSIVLTATEMQAARIVIYIADVTATKVWLDTSLTIETYGNASAQHAVDLDDAVRAGLSALPNAAADAAGGLPISDAGGLNLDGRLDADVSSRLAPTVAARTLDVTAAGNAGIDWGNIENKSTANDLSATDIQLTDTVTTLTGHTPQTGDSFARIGVNGAGLTNINLPNQTMDIIGNITGNLSGSVGSVTGAVIVGTINANVITATSIAASALDGKGDWNIGKTGYTLIQAFPTNFADLAITVTLGEITIGTNNDKTGYSVSALSANVITAASIAASALDGKGDWNIGKTGYSLTITPPTAIQNRQEMDTNSTQLADIVEDTGITLPALIDDLAIKKNTAFSNFEFLMVLTSDGRTPATGLTVTGQRSIDGGAFASVTGTIAEVSNGIYQFDALAADTNGDVITWRFSSATADDTFVTFKTVA